MRVRPLKASRQRAGLERRAVEVHAVLVEERGEVGDVGELTYEAVEKLFGGAGGNHFEVEDAVGVSDVLEGVRLARRNDGVASGSKFQGVVANDESESSGDDVEDFGFLTVGVEGRSFAGHGNLFEAGEGAVDGGAGDDAADVELGCGHGGRL